MESLKELEKKHIMHTYTRDIFLDHGKGCYVFDKQGKKYLDFITGIACVPVGHANRAVTEAICKQAKKLIQVSNLYYTEPQVELAEKLAKLSQLEKCFFCNSGTEANEAAIKLAKKATGKNKFIAFKDSFHGRTTGSLAATWKAKYKQKFEPLAPDVEFVDYNDPEAVEKKITGDIAAVIVEPIQGEAGIIVPDKGYLKKLGKISRDNGILMIVDEVQSGNGRTGRFFAFLHEDVKPDIVTAAKGLANGVPIGVCMSKGIEFDKGDHASTFGGNNLACAAANATIDYILENNLMDNAAKMGDYFMEKLGSMDGIKRAKGKGLMVGAELKDDVAKATVKKCAELGLLVNNPTENILRFLPALIVAKEQIDEAVYTVGEALKWTR